MLNKRRIQLAKAFVENPSAENAIRMARHHKVNRGLNSLICEVLGDKDRFCRGCAWEPICQLFIPSYRVTEKEISAMVRADVVTDERLSAMLLDAIQLLAMCEAKNA